jgi:hypothetical protein
MSIEDAELQIVAFAHYRHVLKCRNGHTCPIGFCSRLAEQTRQNFLSLTRLNQHYKKCRVEASSSTDVKNNHCLCGVIRKLLQALQIRHFPEGPLSLALISVCSVPIGADLSVHPVGELVTELRRAAKIIQRKWRAHLQARGPAYRISPCRLYMGRGVVCRNGVNCTFAHGHHDLRPRFGIPSEQERDSVLQAFDLLLLWSPVEI